LKHQLKKLKTPSEKIPSDEKAQENPESAIQKVKDILDGFRQRSEAGAEIVKNKAQSFAETAKEKIEGVLLPSHHKNETTDDSLKKDDSIVMSDNVKAAYLGLVEGGDKVLAESAPEKAPEAVTGIGAKLLAGIQSVTGLLGSKDTSTSTESVTTTA